MSKTQNPDSMMQFYSHHDATSAASTLSEASLARHDHAPNSSTPSPTPVNLNHHPPQPLGAPYQTRPPGMAGGSQGTHAHAPTTTHNIPPQAATDSPVRLKFADKALYNGSVEEDVETHSVDAHSLSAKAKGITIPEEYPPAAKLLLIIQFLHRKDKLAEREKTVLKRLVLNRDAIVEAALLTWETDHDADELADTFRLLAQHARD